MQPAMQPGPQASATAVGGAPPGAEGYLDRYWVATAAFLRRFSLVLSETWYDGVYLTAWPRVAALAPYVTLVLGLLEGATHWTFMLGGDVQPGQNVVAFTELLPFMALVAVASALSANLGLLLVLGYALGDFFVAGPPLVFVPPYAQGNPLLEFVNLRGPQLISYALFLLLVITPTLSAKYLTARLRGLLRVGDQAFALLRALALAAVQGAFVYSWTLAAPLLIRVFWGWADAPPPVSAAYYLQVQGGWLFYSAAAAAALRGWLVYVANGKPALRPRVRRLADALAAADARRAFTRRIPPIVAALLSAAALTLFLSGFIADLIQAAIILAFIALILIARSIWLPRLAPWTAWSRLITRVPVVVRLVAVFVAGNYESNYIVTLMQTLPPYSPTASGTFLPVLVSTCAALITAVILLPAVAESGEPAVSGSPPAAGRATQPA